MSREILQITEAGELAEVKCRKDSHCLLKDKERNPSGDLEKLGVSSTFVPQEIGL